jgi:transposase
MTNFREILRLRELGINNTQIAESCGHSRPTVVSAIRAADAAALTYEKASGMSDKQLFALLTPGERAKPAYKMPDYDHIHKEMARSGVTLGLLWVEYCEACKNAGEVPYKYTQFCKYYADHLKKTSATMRVPRKPGEVMEVDWSGQGAEITDNVTGEVIGAPVFVAVLPYSGYAYAEAFLSQEKECWIAGHVNAYRYFGGSTRILRPDNTKTAITSNARGAEAVVNKSYQEMAEHYGTAVIPARVRKPRDKSTVEDTVGIIATWILAAMRDERFLSLAELNAAIREKLEAFNRKPFQKKEGSRHSVFQDEKEFLQPLPRHHFELSEWKTLTVQPNYHVCCAGQNYSAPFEYIGRKVDARITRNTVEMFFDGNRICSHARLHGRAGQYSTNEAHMPPKHKHALWNGDRFRGWASKIGGNTAVVVEMFLGDNKIEQQGYKSCNILLHLADKYSRERLENACAKALSYTARPSLKGIQAILASDHDKILTAAADEDDAERHGFIRGAAYYGGDPDAE